MLLQLGCILISSSLEKPAQEEVRLQRLHVLLKRRYPGIRVFIELLIVDQRSDGASALINFGADGPEIAGRLLNVLNGFLAGVQDLVSFFDQVRNLQGRLASNGIAIVYLGGRRRSK
jgi:hypothetical protein